MKKNYWTEKFSRKEVVQSTENLIDKIILSLQYSDIDLLNNHSLTIKELNMLFRWPLFVSVGIFIERLMQLTNNSDLKLENNTLAKNYTYYNNLIDATKALYYDEKLNDKLISDISNILTNKKKELNDTVINKEVEAEANSLLKKNYTLLGLRNLIKRKIVKFYDYFYEYEDIDFLYDNSKHLNLIFEKKNKIREYEFKFYKINNRSRLKMKECFNKEFIKFLDLLFFKSLNLDNIKKKEISNLFSIWVDSSIPQSIFEGLQERINFYNIKYMNNSKLKSLHTTLGIYTMENWKVLALLAKRKNIRLIGHEHGINNFIENFPEDDRPLFSKGNHMFYGADYHLIWGIDDQNDQFKKGKGSFKTKIYSLGSVYLHTLGKIENKNNNFKKEMNLLFINSPLNKYMTNLHEILPEVNLMHKENVCVFLKQIINKYDNVKIFYKDFPNNYKSIANIILKEEIQKNRIIITNENPTKLMKKVDLVIFDMISTGVAESFSMDVPTFIYSHDYFYTQATKNGRKINDELEKNGILFYDKVSGMQSLNNFILNKEEFINSTKEIIKKFQKNISYSVSKEQFIESLKQLN